MKKLLSMAYIAITMLFTLHVVAQDSESSIKKLNVKIGFAAYNFSDPSIVGDNTFINTGGINAGSYNGFRGLTGIYLKLSYYLNDNVGVFTDVTLLNNTVEHYVDPNLYKSNADMNFIKLGLTGQIVGNDYPIRLNIGTGVGIAMSNLSYSESYPIGGTYLSGADSNIGLFLNAELTIPIYKFVHFFSQFEYMYMPASSLTLEHDGGDEYFFRYYDADLGGYIIKLGLSFDIL